MSRIILNLVSVFLVFDGNPRNIQDPTFHSYGCTTYLISTAGRPDERPVPCSTWYDARADRLSEYFTEAEMPAPGEVLMGCVYAFDEAGNRSACVAQDPGPVLELTGLACEEATEVAGPCEEYVVTWPAAPGEDTEASTRRKAGTDRIRRGPAGRR